MMDSALRQRVRSRATGRCEYCRLPESGHVEQFSLDHVIATKHGGEDSEQNLAFSCLRCNLHKGANLSGIDPITGQIVALFNPRREPWHDHFRWSGAVITGTTPTGRATIAVLAMNAAERVRVRQALMAEGYLSLD